MLDVFGHLKPEHQYEGEKHAYEQRWKVLNEAFLELELQNVSPKKDARVVMLGNKHLADVQPLKWRQQDGGLTVDIPRKLQDENNRPCKQAWAFRIELPASPRR